MAYMINKELVYRMTNLYSGRYNYMINSSNAVDQANAEACRIGARAWQRIGREVFTRLDEHGNELPPFQEEDVIAESISAWKAYLLTGEPGNDVRDITQETMAKFRQDILSRIPAPTVPAPELKKDDGGKKERPVKRLEKTEKTLSPVEIQAEKIRKSNLENVSERAIDEVIQSIRSAFSVDKQNDVYNAGISTNIDVPSMAVNHTFRPAK